MTTRRIGNAATCNIQMTPKMPEIPRHALGLGSKPQRETSAEMEHRKGAQEEVKFLQLKILSLPLIPKTELIKQPNCKAARQRGKWRK